MGTPNPVGFFGYVPGSLNPANTAYLVRFRGCRKLITIYSYAVYPETSIFGMSRPNASAISWFPMLAMHCIASVMWIGLRLERSLRID